MSSSPNFCAFLRGVNVKGTNMKMAEVKSVFEQAGMHSVKTILASGNLLFYSECAESELKEKLSLTMSNHFDYEAYLFIKTAAEIKQLCEDCPFEPDPTFHNYGFVGVAEIGKILAAEFDKSTHAEGEAGKLIGDNFYWRAPKGDTLVSDFGKILGRKSLKDAFTSRNINTFYKVLNAFKG
ncbi:MAG: DUF1697 domain-containing protein [Pedobacter sp.]|nr:MAG: DUF1697 domain-containing protein [Pedobacter sp.]